MDLIGQHILIVDDVLKNLQITAKILKEEGFVFSLAKDGQSALAHLENHIPDLILLDIMMPGMDGLEVCRKIKQNERLKEIPIIFLTAKNQTEDMVEGFKAGGVDYIFKPFNRDELLVRVKNHLELSGSRKKILEMNKTRDKLYSIIAHDIRSPLSSISLTISAIAHGYLNPCDDDFMVIIKDLDEITNKTNSLLSNLLAWTKLQNDTVTLTPNLINIYDVLLVSTQLLLANANRKKIIIQLDAPEDIQAFVDEVTIQIAFRNIISNAIKFTPEGGTISIKGIVNRRNLTISIKDSGQGMSDETIQKIFHNNEHYSTLGTNKEQGSGLGLYFVKDFIEKNRGEMIVSSTLGVGTEITINLPLSN